MFTRFLMFGVLGVFGAVIASCIRRLITTRKIAFSGEASLLPFPFWGLIAFLYPLIGIHLGSVPWYGRGLIYMVTFYLFQLLIGLGLKKFNLCPWRYSGKASLLEVVRLDDAPVWLVAGLSVEWIYPFVKIASSAL